MRRIAPFFSCVRRNSTLPSVDVLSTTMISKAMEQGISASDRKHAFVRARLLNVGMTMLTWGAEPDFAGKICGDAVIVFVGDGLCFLTARAGSGFCEYACFNFSTI